MPVLRIVSLVALSLSAAAFAADPSTPAAPAAAATPAPAEKLICRKTPEIGSLIKVRKECATRAEWKRRDLGARDTTREIQTVGGSAFNQ